MSSKPGLMLLERVLVVRQRSTAALARWARSEALGFTLPSAVGGVRRRPGGRPAPTALTPRGSLSGVTRGGATVAILGTDRLRHIDELPSRARRDR